jgi:DNA-directed RNA polymerase specialized sigma24 family protein
LLVGDREIRSANAGGAVTKEEFGTAYETGYNRTTRFLVSRGVSADVAEETAQAAWAKGWEKRDQLLNFKMLGTWVNAIALNLYRSSLRNEPLWQELNEVQALSTTNLEVIDLQRVLKRCKKNDRIILQRHYLEGYRIREIAGAYRCSETAVRIRLLRARRAVAKKLVA